MKAVIAAILLTATAVQASPDYVNLGGVSYHYDTDGRAWGFNESNPGLGATWSNKELPLVGTVDVSAGVYHNSLGRDAAYVSVDKLPFNFLTGRAGVAVILATGYEIPVLPIAAPTACWKYACILITPPVKGVAVGMASIQFRLPISH